MAAGLILREMSEKSPMTWPPKTLKLERLVSMMRICQCLNLSIRLEDGLWH
jgi:hypothetical protein